MSVLRATADLDSTPLGPEPLMLERTPCSCFDPQQTHCRARHQVLAAFLRKMSVILVNNSHQLRNIHVFVSQQTSFHFFMQFKFDYSDFSQNKTILLPPTVPPWTPSGSPTPGLRPWQILC